MLLKPHKKGQTIIWEFVFTLLSTTSGEMDSILARTVSYLDDRLYDPKQSDGSGVF